jgi:phosphoribosylamine--glycine ligase
VVTIVLAAQGYPSTPQIGDPITGVDSVEGAFVHQAGTTLKDGVLHSAGGRVLSVTAIGPNLAVARSKAYEGISQITLRGSHYRSDIALAASTQNKTTEVTEVEEN